MKIIGIDPGSRTTGYGVIEVNSKGPQFVSCGLIRLEDKALPNRLRQLFQSLSEVFRRFEPDHCAIEEIFLHKQTNSALKLGQARGAAITAMQDIPIAEYTPRKVKLAVVGYGNASKTQIQYMVRSLLSLPENPTADAADALAVALCHFYNR